ncbi:hypothetical protein HDR58_03005 [bacterium]|nr:hypothetical protein [bacterium]
MKKSLVIMLSLIVTFFTGFACVFAAQYSKFSAKFIKNFQDCDSYEEVISSEFEGRTFTTTRKILGWRNGICRYQEIIKTQDEQYKLNCTFNSIQLDELYDAMKSKSKEVTRQELELFAEQKDPKTGQIKYVPAGTTTIKGDIAYLTWAKYQNNPYFCKPQKL